MPISEERLFWQGMIERGTSFITAVAASITVFGRETVSLAASVRTHDVSLGTQSNLGGPRK